MGQARSLWGRLAACARLAGPLLVGQALGLPSLLGRAAVPKEHNIDMRQIIYASAATKPFTREDLVQLLKISRQRNTAAGISGMLLYHHGSFLQVLEGPAESVEALYVKIGADPRHINLLLLSRRTIQKKEFENWSMGFVDTTAVAVPPAGFVDYAMQLHGMTLDQTGARKILRRFQDGAWRRAEYGCF